MILARCWLLAGSLACYACSPTVSQREACYASAEIHASTRAVSECRAGWKDCAAHDEIMTELATTERGCP